MPRAVLRRRGRRDGAEPHAVVAVLGKSLHRRTTLHDAVRLLQGLIVGEGQHVRPCVRRRLRAAQHDTAADALHRHAEALVGLALVCDDPHEGAVDCGLARDVPVAEPGECELGLHQVGDAAAR